MAIIIHTSSSKTLLSRIRSKIINGECIDWKYDADGDFTQTSSQYEDRAWLHAVIELENELIFAIYGRKDERMTKETYAVYHCKFAEFLLNTFDADIVEVNLTSMPTKYDSI